MSFTNAVPSVFVTGPDDKLAVVDIYSGAPTTPQNVQPPIANVANDVASVFNHVADLANSATSEINGVVKDVDYVTNLAKSAIPAIAATISHAKAQLLNKITNAINATGIPNAIASADNAIGSLYNTADALRDAKSDIRADFQGVSEAYSVNNLEDALGLTEIINAISGDDTDCTMVDLKGQRQTLVGLITTAIYTGMPQSIPSILSTARAEDQYPLILAILQAAASMGDFLTFYEYWPRLNTVGDLLAAFPNIVTTLVKNYKFPKSYKYPSQGISNELRAVLNLLQPTWAYTAGVGHLEVITVCSADAKEQLYKQSDLVGLVAASTIRLPSTILDVTQKLMPWVALPGAAPAIITGAQKPAAVLPVVVSRRAA